MAQCPFCKAPVDQGGVVVGEMILCSACYEELPPDNIRPQLNKLAAAREKASVGGYLDGDDLRSRLGYLEYLIEKGIIKRG